MTNSRVASRLVGERATFEAVAGAPPSVRSVARAVAAHVQTLRSGNSRVDRYLYCGEQDALTGIEIRGLGLFTGKADCAQCHVFAHESVHPFGGGSGLFTDFRFHTTGAGQQDDPGRAAVTRNPADQGAFRTPSLRNVALTAPYMHDGSIKTLRGVVDFYNRGGRRHPNLDPGMNPLGLSDTERGALVAFLRALTSSELATRANTKGALR